MCAPLRVESGLWLGTLILTVCCPPSTRLVTIRLADSFSLYPQRFEAGDHVEQFLVYATLA
jgi:hypothetical protein